MSPRITPIPFLLVCFFAPIMLLGQGNEAAYLIQEINLYYNPNAYEIGAAGKEKLEALKLYAKDCKDVRYHIKSFTDDVGRKEDNEELGKRRTSNVYTYLLDNDKFRGTLILDQPELLKLDPTQDIALQRKENRKVTVQLWGVELLKTEMAPELFSFFEEGRKTAQQYFKFNASSGNSIKGTQGTILIVEPDAFFMTDGKPYKGEVTLVLQEAYTSGELLSQNLTTRSGEKILESGGTIYVGALDENGGKLILDKAKPIRVAFSGKGAQKIGMSVFEGSSDPSGNIDWKVTAQLINNQANNPQKIEAQVKNAQLAEYLAEIVRVPNIQKRIKVVDEPTEVEMPEMPKLVEKPTFEKLLKYNKQGFNESDAAFRVRLDKMFEQEMAKYNKYQAEMVVYTKEKLRYDQYIVANESFKKNQEELKELINQLASDLAQFDLEKKKNKYKIFFNTISYSLTATKEVSDELAAMKEELEDLIEKGFDMEDLLAKVKTFKVVQYNKTEKKILEKLANRCNFIGKSLLGDKFIKNDKMAFYASLSYLTEKAQDLKIKIKEKGIYSEEINAYHRIVEKLGAYDFEFVQKIGNEINSLDAEQQALFEKSFATVYGLGELKTEITDKKKALGALPPAELMKTYENEMKLYSLNWINCDRFWNDRSPKISIEVLAKADEFTRFFVVFEDMRAIMPGIPSLQGYKVHNIPADRIVKIVGIRIIDNRAELCIQKGKASEFSHFEPSFNKMTKEEARKLIAGL